MKSMKKIATLFLAICLLVPCFSILTHAANAIQFDDPETAVGQTLELKGVIKSNNSIGDRTIKMTYDTSKLSFVSGEHVTEPEKGKLTYEVTGETGGTRVEFFVKFDVIEEGKAFVKAEQCVIKSTNGTTLTYTLGSSAITINPGEESADTSDETETNTDEQDLNQNASRVVTVEVNEKEYTISSELPSDVPEGFLPSTLDVDGIQHIILKQEETGIRLAYLKDASGEGQFFLYVEENASFVPFVQIEISDMAKITILSYVENVTMPAPYALTEITFNDDDAKFPAWYSETEEGIFILWALDSKGEKSFYKYDESENTYQKFDVSTLLNAGEESSVKGKVDSVFGIKLEYVVILIAVVFIFFAITMVVLGVKLHNRNAELDELYDEYGVLDKDEDEDDEAREFVMFGTDEEDDEYEDLSESDTEDSEDDSEIEDIKINIDMDEDVEILEDNQENKTFELEEDILFETSDEGNLIKDEVELDFDILFSEDVAEKESIEEESFFDDDDFNFEMDFIDFND